MSQVSLMPVEIGISPELQGAELAGMSSFEGEGKQNFADFMERQIHADKAVDSNKDNVAQVDLNVPTEDADEQALNEYQSKVSSGKNADSEQASKIAIDSETQAAKEAKYLVSEQEIPTDLVSDDSHELLSMLVASEKLLKAETTPIKAELTAQKLETNHDDGQTDDVMAELSDDEQMIAKLAGQKGKAQVEQSLNQLTQQYTNKNSDTESADETAKISDKIVESKVVEAKPLTEAELRQLAQQALGRSPVTETSVAKKVSSQPNAEELVKVGSAQNQTEAVDAELLSSIPEEGLSEHAAKGEQAASFVNQMKAAKSADEINQTTNNKIVAESETDAEDTELSTKQSVKASLEASPETKPLTTAEAELAKAQKHKPQPIEVNAKAPVENLAPENRKAEAGPSLQSVQGQITSDTKSANQATIINTPTQVKMLDGDNAQDVNSEQISIEEGLAKEEVNLKPEVVLKEGAKQASSNNQTSLASAGISNQAANQIHSATPASYESQVSAAQVESLANRQQTETLNQVKQAVQANETINVYSKDFSKSVKEKVMVMMNQKLQFAEIRLDPPELGNMHVRVNLQNEVAAVQFLVQNQQAKEALEQHMGKTTRYAVREWC